MRSDTSDGDISDHDEATHGRLVTSTPLSHNGIHGRDHLMYLQNSPEAYLLDQHITPIQRPPSLNRSAPTSLSRLFKTKRRRVTAKELSFKNPGGNTLSKLYDPTNEEESYYEQVYTKSEKIGAGSFSDVFKAQSLEDEKWYAIKVSNQEYRGRTDKRCKRQEVAKLEMIPPHPNIITFCNAWEQSERLHICTELCEATLKTRYEVDVLTENKAWKHMADVLMALKHLNNHGFVHMDVKPENILLTQDGTCKLGDFGLLHNLNQNGGKTDIEHGDGFYLAPELLDTPPTVTFKADIFSLGITILELIIHHENNRVKLKEQLHNFSITDEQFDHVSYGLKEVLRRMVHPVPQQRITVEELLTHPCISKIVQNATVTVNDADDVLSSHDFQYPSSSEEERELLDKFTETPSSRKIKSARRKWHSVSRRIAHDRPFNNDSSAMDYESSLSSIADEHNGNIRDAASFARTLQYSDDSSDDGTPPKGAKVMPSQQQCASSAEVV